MIQTVASSITIGINNTLTTNYRNVFFYLKKNSLPKTLNNFFIPVLLFL